jgi:hypothetical protein
MNRQDQELLDKQFRVFNQQQRGTESAMALSLLAVFLTGMAVGGFLFALKPAPLRFASRETMALSALSSGPAQPTQIQ